MNFSLNKSLDPTQLGTAFRQNKRLQISDFFPDDQAQEIFKHLSTKTSWGLFYKGPEKGIRIMPEDFKNTPPEKLNEIYRYIFESARKEYQFMYLFHNLTGDTEGEKTFLNDVAAFMASEEVLGLIREITGLKEIFRADAQATRYIGNCFLHPHTDEGIETGRRIAYVLNMTKQWDPNWGGYLQFFDEDMNISDAFKPSFNTLNIFQVPQGHAVGYVPPFCPGERLSITGWFRDQ